MPSLCGTQNKIGEKVGFVNVYRESILETGKWNGILQMKLFDLLFDTSPMLFSLFLVFSGFFLLMKGSDYLVKGSSSIARTFGIPMLVIGLTVVAFGTSAPEFFVNVISAFRGSTDIAIGNILGSNLANILMILGVTAMLKPIALKSSTVWKEIPLSMLGILLVFIFCSDVLLDGAVSNSLSRVEGIVLLGFFVIFLIYTFTIAKDKEVTDEVDIDQMKLPVSVLFTLGGLTALSFGGRFVVEGASEIAHLYGVSQNLIALTIVSVGTSLPELMTSVAAIRKGHDDLAIGNIIGSNIFNIFFILATTAIIRPLPFAAANSMDIFFAMTATLILFLVMFVGKRHVIERWSGATFLAMYAGFLAFVLIRG